MAEKKAFLLRIDPRLWTELESWAAAELRSVNGQIEFLLKQAVQKRKNAPMDYPGRPEQEEPGNTGGHPGS